ncbi:MAG: beta-N-acetylhexosaminidase [Bacilli bacterium]|nr:beta-N-acetylhexosaminidase [Bacilli bacterium]
MKEKFLINKLTNMSLKEKIGQMIMIDYRDTLEMNVELDDILNKYSPGGFILFKSNIQNYNQTKKLLSDIKQSSDIPVMVSADQEGGRVQRLDERVGFDTIPPMGEIGKTMNEEEVFNLGKKMGEELKNIGVDMDMAPVLDVFSNPENRVIADRAFGTNSDIVKRLAMALSKGLQEEKIIPVGKHFPGHGDTLKDSHVDLPIITKDLEELKRLELVPFVEAIDKKIPGLMIGHLAVPKITGDNNPASLSKVMINDLLRKDLGYEGLVMPDSLKMKALSNHFTNKEIYLRCIGSGNDIMLMPQNINEAFNTIYDAVNDGVIKEEQINNSVYRILSTKFDIGFFDKELNEFINKKSRSL